MKNKIWLLLILFLLSSNALFAGAFSVGVYGNFEGRYEEGDTTATLPVATNADWKSQWVNSYYELKLSGRNISGFDLWSKLGVSATFIENSKGILSSDYTSSFFNPGGILSGLQNSEQNNFEIRQFEAHIQRTFKYKKGQTYLAIYRGEDRTDIGQPYLRFTKGQGNGETKAGIYWDGNGLLGFSVRGFLMDYQSDEQDAASTGNRHEYSGGLRISRDILSKDWMNFKIGVTGGAMEYYRRYVLDNISGSQDLTNYNTMYYNVAGFDTTFNGAVPKIFNYYVFFGLGRSYAPENFQLENKALSSLLGNSNSVQYVGEIKLDRKLDFGNLDLGRMFLGYFIKGRQEGNQLYLHDNGGGDFPYQFEERLSFTYNFPVKMVTLNGNLEYYHDHDDFDLTKYHVWQVGDIVDTSVSFKQNLTLNILFKGGYSFNVKWDKNSGNNYLGSFLPDGVHFLTLKVAGESQLGRLSPQLNIAALGDPDKQIVSSGIELFLNLSSWLTFYSRTAYVVSKGFWKSEIGNLTWWNAFIKLEMRTGDNSKLALELGENGDTSDGFVSDLDLIKNGKDFAKKVYVKFEYWM